MIKHSLTPGMIFVVIVFIITSCSLIKIETGPPSTGQSSSSDFDPALKKDIRGSLSIAYAWGQRLSPPQQYSRALINLKDAMLKWTKINTRLVEHLRLDSDELLQMPFVYIATDQSFELTEQEKSNIKNYLLKGGFLVLDNATPQLDQSQAEASLRKMIRDSIGSGVRFEPIPNDHAIYHSYFDFDDGPPIGSENQMVTTSRTPMLDSSGQPTGQERESKLMPRRVLYLEGVWISDRLVAVLSNKGYVVKWNEMYGNEPQLKMGVNMAVFALTQPGGIAHQE